MRSNLWFLRPPLLAHGRCHPAQNASTDTATNLKRVLAAKIPEERKRRISYRRQYREQKLSVNSFCESMQGMCGLAHPTSMLDPQLGIKFRGLTLPECRSKLPPAPNGSEPLPESLFWLLITGDIPTEAQVRALSKDWAARAEVPFYIVNMVKKFPADMHPMTQMSTALNSLDSKFVKAYSQGIFREKSWEYVYEDSMDLIAKIPTIAALIHHQKKKTLSQMRSPDPQKDWAANFLHMLKLNDRNFSELMRLYLTIHSDHDGGNIASDAGHLTGSALSDPYKAFSAGLTEMAEPLAGNTNQCVLTWLQQIQTELGASPTEEQLTKFVWKTLQADQAVPGFGHSVFVNCDTRYLCLQDFARKHTAGDPLCQLVSLLEKVVPPILKEHGKISNPWPTVDAHSGVMLHYYGLKDPPFYKVVLGIARALGALAALVWDRALGIPIERRKSASTDMLIKQLTSAKHKPMFVY